MSENETPKNPLLEKARIPGETFTLPSRGIFYNRGELDSTVKNGEVMVYPMAAIDEIILKTPDKLFSGQAIEDVFKRCVPQVLKPMQLHAQDVDYLLTCLRLLSFGDTIEVVFDHECEKEGEPSQSYKYTFSIQPFIKGAKQIDPTKVGTTYSVKFANGQTVSLSPPRFESSLKLYQSAAQEDQNVDIKQVGDELTELFLGIVQDVDGVTDQDNIAEWLKTIPAGYVRQMNEAVMNGNDWGPEFEVTAKCKGCGEDITISSPLNPIALFM